MVPSLLGTLTVYGRNFTPQAKVLLDGKALNVRVLDSLTIEANLGFDGFYTPGVHEVTVSDLGGFSNALPWTVYQPDQGPQVFSAIPAYYAGTFSPWVIAAADVTGDGFDDVIMTGSPAPGSGNSQRIAILEGRGDGALALPRFVSGAAEFGLATGDVNGDGSTDFVSFADIGIQSATYSVYVNDGAGNFNIHSTGFIDAAFPHARLIDIDADNRLDLLVSTNSPNVIYLLKNQGGGNFGAPQTLASISAGMRKFEVADFNGDHLPDIIYNFTNTVTWQDEIHWLRNLGSGSFADAIPADLAGVSGQISVGDFNLDGQPDLAIQPAWPTWPSLRVFLGVGNGAFRSVWDGAIEWNGTVLYSLGVGDFDHDGFPDLAGPGGSGHILYLWGDGTGAFTPQKVNGPNGFLSAVGDINGDSNPDVVVAASIDMLFVALGREERNYPSPTSLALNYSGRLSVADVNGDGLQDLFSAKSTLYLGQSKGRFVLAPGTPADALMIADLNDDGLADYIGCDGHNILIWPGTGIPEAPRPVVIIPLFAGISFPFGFEVLDLDRDGQLDLLAAGGIDEFNSTILYGRSNFEFDVVWGRFRGEFVTGDFNNDGIIDITGYSGTLLGKGDREFRLISDRPRLTSNLVKGDFNGDNFTDIAYSGGDAVIVSYSRGDGTLYPQSVLLGWGEVGGMVAEDFNGDGRLDIVTGLLSGQLVLYINNGQGGFKRSFHNTGDSTTHLISADFNKDGKPDVAIRGSGDPKALVIFAMPVSLTVAPTTVSPGGVVTARWSGIASPTPNDWLALYASSGVPSSSPIAWRYTNGLANSNLPFNIPANAAPGTTYELRLWSNSGYTRLATSNRFAVQATTLSIGPATVNGGGTVTATWANIPNPTAKDWLALYPSSSAPNSPPVAWRYTNGLAASNLSFNIPANAASGSTYELRLWSNNGYTRLATRNRFTIQATTLTVRQTAVSAGGSVAATWANVANPSATDWLALYASPSSANSPPIAWRYTDGLASSNLPFNIPANAVPGTTYELRLWSNNGYTRLATSNSFAIQAPTLSVSPTKVSAGGSVTATWAKITNPSATDWLALYASSGAPNSPPIAWRYTNGIASSNVLFNIPESVPPGTTYELRLWSNNGYTRLATSGPFTVE